ncbi:hypothetical protein FHS31_001259 [Sphingomonas vulcanisoli]|uniref:Uncharacterized protein n=1 Tax=Sphingomonas vulcanisoli TaxID=1658060 RepID=A0ABX0TQ56_9SPHN|nr:hypothetical protein [Sphingomonas vulcanisoli]NIJ07663.1 hypothetical protein [Sphingomonas vulcanisoli]
MKFAIIAATALAAVAVPAASQHVERRTVIRHDEHRGPVVVRTVRHRKVCTVRWVHHQKVRRCR